MAKKGSEGGKKVRVSALDKRAFKRQGEWKARHPDASQDERSANLMKVWFEEGGLGEPLSDLHTAKCYETDRGCVIVAASIIDGELEKMLRLFFAVRAPGSDKFVDSLFVSEDRSVPMLQGTSIKIKLAYVLGLIGNDLRKACAQIQHLRSNVYAHTKTSKFLKFKDSLAIFRCMKGLFREPVTQLPEGADESTYIHLDDQDPKESFFMAAFAVITGLELAVKDTKRLRPRRIKSGSSEIGLESMGVLLGKKAEG